MVSRYCYVVFDEAATSLRSSAAGNVESLELYLGGGYISNLLSNLWDVWLFGVPLSWSNIFPGKSGMIQDECKRTFDKISMLGHSDDLWRSKSLTTNTLTVRLCHEPHNSALLSIAPERERDPETGAFGLCGIIESSHFHWRSSVAIYTLLNHTSWINHP